jgi:hypothetical protein
MRAPFVVVAMAAAALAVSGCSSGKAKAVEPTTTSSTAPTSASRITPRTTVSVPPTTSQPPTSTTSTVPAPAITATPVTTAPVPTPPLRGPRAFVVSPDNITVGSSVTFAGNGCPTQDVASVALVTTNGMTSLRADPAADGSWTLTTTVPDGALLGHRHAVASCRGRRQFGEKFPYDSVPIYVSTFRRLIVSPTTDVHPGSPLSISESGGCPTDEPVAVGGLVEIDKVPYITYAPGRYEAFAADAKGHWSGVYVVPHDIRPGNFFLNAECPGYSREGPHAYYPSIPITVT